jgi:hypothetical protein
MKKLISIIFITTILLNLAFAVDKREKQTAPAPEVIKCESQGTCEMTPIKIFLQSEKKNQFDANEPNKEKERVN